MLQIDSWIQKLPHGRCLKATYVIENGKLGIAELEVDVCPKGSFCAEGERYRSLEERYQP